MSNNLIAKWPEFDRFVSEDFPVIAVFGFFITVVAILMV